MRQILTYVDRPALKGLNKARVARDSRLEIGSFYIERIFMLEKISGTVRVTRKRGWLYIKDCASKRKNAGSVTPIT